MTHEFYSQISEEISRNTGYTTRDKLNMLTQLTAMARYDVDIEVYDYCDLAEEIAAVKRDVVERS